jgi:hypothetical protein
MSRLLQAAIMDWPVHSPGQDTTRSGLWTHALGLMCAQVGGTRKGISISCPSFSLSPTNAHVFKIEMLVFQIVTLAKRQQDIPFLGSVIDSIRHLGFFF